MDKREAQEVVNETVSGLVGGYIIALMLIAALPIVGWALLFGLAGAIAFPGLVLFLAAAALLLVLLFGGLGMLDAWFGKREAQRRAARVAADGDYLTARERRLKTAWDQGRAAREAPRQNPIAFALGRALGWALRRRPAMKEITR
jgi:hypothetical protein